MAPRQPSSTPSASTHYGGPRHWPPQPVRSVCPGVIRVGSWSPRAALPQTDLYDFGARSYDPSLAPSPSFDSVSGSAAKPPSPSIATCMPTGTGHWWIRMDTGNYADEGGTRLRADDHPGPGKSTGPAADRSEERNSAARNTRASRRARRNRPWYQHEEAQRECTAHGLNAAGRAKLPIATRVWAIPVPEGPDRLSIVRDRRPDRRICAR